MQTIKMTWYGDVRLKQWADSEFLVAEKKSVTNIHKQFKNVCIISAVD
jgi:hypothetical protein